ncbi:MAG TPA: ABC transporter permease [Longimicrobiales bacterium]|nr:ABC transporter permease [Longimicrobiales bacterium]
MGGWARFRGLFGPDPERDVDDELSFHIEMRTRELETRGESPERARELALARFGSLERPRAECVAIDERRGRRHARAETMSELRQDVAFALRTLARAPVFTLVAVATLALGIGANTAIFSVVHAVLLEALPFRDADRLHEISTVYPDGTSYPLSPPDFMSVQADARHFEDVVALRDGPVTLLGRGDPQEVVAAQVSAGFAEFVGLRFVLGRPFARAEHDPGRHRVAVLTHGFWQRELGGARDVVGRTLDIEGDPYEVIGVLAEGSTIAPAIDLYAPLLYDERYDATTARGRRGEFLTVIGRARPGVAAEQLEADLRRVGSELAARFPDTNGRLTFGAAPLRERLVGDVRTPLLVLLGAVGFVLLIACANVANLLLARASARQGELAVRAALGAGRGRLVRQLLTESTVLSLLGGAAGLLLAHWATAALVRAQAGNIPRVEEVGLDGTVLLATLAISLLTGLVFGTVPALQATRPGLTLALREEGRGVVGRAGQRLRSGLIVAEIAVAVVLLVGAGLLLRSFAELTRVDPGFRTEQALSFRIQMTPARYPEGEQVRAFADRLIAQLERLPGVTAVAAASSLPLTGVSSLISFAVTGAPPPPDDVNAEISILSVTPGYFGTLGARIASGRDFTEHDRGDAPLVALINEAGARKWFPGENPVGRRVTAVNDYEVVGVVSDVLQENPGTPAVAELYVPYQQRSTRTLRVVVRSRGAPATMMAAIRSELRQLDETMAVRDLAPLEQLVSRSVAQPRFFMALLALFAAGALLLAAIGVFGVLNYSVTQRARELSIRMALGARAPQVVGMIVRRSVLLAGAGLAIGVAAALALGGVLRSQLFQVGVVDPLTLGAVALVLLAVVVLASWLPARRAAAMDPGLMLRG